ETPDAVEAARHALSDAGWQPHINLAETVWAAGRPVRKANSDFKLVYHAGRLIGRGRTDVVVVGSGDGDLVSSLARDIATGETIRPVMTLSLAGSTAGRLDASGNSLIAANLEVGLDCLTWAGC